jgi:hypothetical protein
MVIGMGDEDVFKLKLVFRGQRQRFLTGIKQQHASPRPRR